MNFRRHLSEELRSLLQDCAGIDVLPGTDGGLGLYLVHVVAIFFNRDEFCI